MRSWLDESKKKKNQTAASTFGFWVIWASWGFKSSTVPGQIWNVLIRNDTRRKEGLCLGGSHYLKVRWSRADSQWNSPRCGGEVSAQSNIPPPPALQCPPSAQRSSSIPPVWLSHLHFSLLLWLILSIPSPNTPTSALFSCFQKLVFLINCSFSFFSFSGPGPFIHLCHLMHHLSSYYKCVGR